MTDDYLTEAEARRALRKAYELSAKEHGRPSWVRVEQMTGINRTTACRIATDRSYFPKRADIRARLGVASLGRAPVCPTCGVVHLKRCPHVRQRKRKDWFAYPVDELSELLENAVNEVRE